MLPLVAKRVSLDAAPVEPPTVEASENWILSLPLAPEFDAQEGASDASDEAALDVSAPPSSPWPMPAALWTQLTNVAASPATENWANRALTQIEHLARLTALDDVEAAQALDRLAQLAEQAEPLAAGLETAEEQSLVRAAAYAISRRVTLWRQIHTLAGQPAALTQPVAATTDEMLTRLDAADAVLGQSRRSSDWRRYLLIGPTRLLAEAGSKADVQLRRRHAQRVLRRLEWPGLTSEQRRFVARPEFQDMASELRAWTHAPLDYSEMLETLEAYEQQPSAALARQVVDYRNRLSWASHRSTNDLANYVDAHYRNANVRVAVSQDLLQLLGPQTSTSVETVTDQIVGAQVKGQSQTTSEVAFRVLPDPHRLRLMLEAKGQVTTDTQSSKSGAVFYSQGQAWFTAQKEIVFDGGVLHMGPASAEARVYDNLQDVATDYDNVPVVNLLAQSIARRGHADARLDARREAEQKVARRAAARLDEEAGKHLDELKSRVQTVVGKPLEDLSLFASPISLQTTESRLVGRYRLAGDLQLGAHTARPQALADSLLSVQVHDSAVNNALGRLPLADREANLPTIFREVVQAIGGDGANVPDDLPENVTVRFAAEDPVRVELNEGRARVTLRLAELQTDGHTWRNIMAGATYRTEANGLSARMVRDGYIELTGDKLRFRDQLALRAIFAKVFSESRALELMPARIAQNEKLANHEVTQLVIRDGWIALAVGPQRSAALARTAKK